MIDQTAPVISESPGNPKIAPELDELLLRALAAGRIAALLLPHLGERACFILENCQMLP